MDSVTIGAFRWHLCCEKDVFIFIERRERGTVTMSHYNLRQNVLHVVFLSISYFLPFCSASSSPEPKH